MHSVAPTSLPASAPASAEYLTFMLAGEIFAIGILSIKEIIEYGELSTVPLMPDCIRGVINLRGAAVPVMDLSTRFGRAPTAPNRRSCIIIVEVEVEAEAEAGTPRARQIIGVMADAVNAVLDIARADIEAAPAFGGRLRSEFLDGMGKVNGKFVLLLNVQQVFASGAIGTTAADFSEAPA